MWDVDQLKPLSATMVLIDSELSPIYGIIRDVHPTPVRHAAKGHIQTFSTVTVDMRGRSSKKTDNTAECQVFFSK